MKAKIKTTDISVTPVKKYASPKYPTRTAANRSPELLRKLPSRWEKNAAVVAAVGMLGAMTLTSCGIGDKGALGGVDLYEPQSEQEITCEITADAGELAGDVVFEIPSEQEVTDETFDMIETGQLTGAVCMDLQSEQDYEEVEETTSFLNFQREKLPVPPGGIGPPSVLSEQDALVIIKGMIESKGLNFESDLSKYPNITNDQIDLYDFKNQVAIVYDDGWTGYGIEKEHTNYNGILVGRFYDPDLCGLTNDQLNEEQLRIYEQIINEYNTTINPISDAEYIVNMKPIIEEALRAQVRDFIEWLQGQGII